MLRRGEKKTELVRNPGDCAKNHFLEVRLISISSACADDQLRELSSALRPAEELVWNYCEVGASNSSKGLNYDRQFRRRIDWLPWKPWKWCQGEFRSAIKSYLERNGCFGKFGTGELGRFYHFRTIRATRTMIPREPTWATMSEPISTEDRYKRQNRLWYMLRTDILNDR